MIALLAARPLRRKNFTRIEVGRHLVREGASWQLRIAGEEIKTGRPIAQPFPAVLVPSLERYLAVHRPVLAALPGPGIGQLVPRCGSPLEGRQWPRLQPCPQPRCR